MVEREEIGTFCDSRNDRSDRPVSTSWLRGGSVFWKGGVSGARPGLLPAFSLRPLGIPAPDSRLTGKSAITL